MKISRKYNLEELGRRIQQDRVETNPLSFEGFGIEDIRSILESGVEFCPEIPEADKPTLIWQAIKAAALRETVTAEALESALKDQEIAYLRQPIRSYVLLTSVTLDPSDAPRRVKVDASRIVFSRRPPKGYSRAPLEADIASYTKIDGSGRLMNVRVPVHARTHAAAFEIAMERFDFWRGLLNYQLNARLHRRWGEARPVNQILLGPIHTVHSPRGKLACNTFWYEPFPQQSARFAEVRGKMPKLGGIARMLVRRFRSCPYGAPLRALFVRYTRALDTADYHLAYSGLWAVMEHLTATVGEYNKLIDRIVFLYDPAEAAYARLLLEHLRDVRNGMVHDSQSRSGMGIYVFQLKSFVEALFRFHLSRKNRFPSLFTAGNFLDSPRDASLLHERITLLRRAHRFHSPRPAV